MQDALSLDYVQPEGLGAYLQAHNGRVLGVIGFGANPGAASREVHPAPLWVRIPVIGGHESCFEVWTGGPATPCGRGNITACTDGELLFGSMQLEQPAGTTFESLSQQAYLEMFAFLDRQACRHLLRVWNYLPRINEPEDGLERYRRFNMGRHQAYTLSGRDIGTDTAPAASVLGCGPGPMVIYFLASRTPGRPVENPRQVASYQYPAQYGPRSPIFARAMLAALGRQPCLLVSGTASIVGYETVHHGDVDRQALETIGNIRALLHQAYPAGSGKTIENSMKLKVYVRNAQDLEHVAAHIRQAFGPEQQTVYLQSDICRTDLLVEIEGVHFGGARV